MSTTAQLAQQALAHFAVKAREDGTQYVSAREGNPPEWVEGLCRAAHDDGRMFPDDWRYTLIREALEIIAEDDDPEARADEWKPSIYRHQLADWLGSHAYRFAYVDEAREVYGPAANIAQDIERGQLAEWHEVYWQVAEFLADLADDED